MQKLILVLTLTFTASTWAATCAIETPSNSERLEKITFPDGREIYMLGYIHGDRELPFKMADLLKVQAAKLSDQQLQAQIDDLAKATVFAIDEEKTDLGQLTHLLKTNAAIKFVGFETEDQFAVSNLDNYEAMLADFHQMVQKRAPGSLAAETDLNDTVLGAAGTLRLTNPELFRSRQIRGFESFHGTEASTAATIAADDALESLKTLAKGDADFTRNINGTGLQLDEIYATYSTDMDATLLQQMGKASMAEKYREGAINWLRLKLAEMAADKLREHDVVENLMEAGTSGILIMGSAHMDGIMAELQQKCAGQSGVQASL